MNNKFDYATTQLIFVELPQDSPFDTAVMFLTKVYKNNVLVDFELVYGDGTSDEFCQKWNDHFVDCDIESLNMTYQEVEKLDRDLKEKIKRGAIKGKESKKSKLQNEIIEADKFVKHGLYESFYIEDGQVWLVPYPEKTFYENESICFYWAKLRYQQQTYINKLNPKFVRKLYNLALLIKASVIDYDDWRYMEYINNNFKYVANELLYKIQKEYIDNNYLPPTLELMYKLAHWIKKQ